MVTLLEREKSQDKRRYITYMAELELNPALVSQSVLLLLDHSGFQKQLLNRKMGEWEMAGVKEENFTESWHSSENRTLCFSTYNHGYLDRKTF